MGKPRNKNPKSNNTTAPDPEPEPSDSSSVVDCGEMNPTVGKNKAKAPPAAAPEPKKLRRAEADAATPSSADVDGPEPMFVGKPLPAEEARRRWPDSYRKKQNDEPSSSKRSKGRVVEEEFIQARYHYTMAEVDGVRYDLNDDAHVWAGEGKPYYICRIVEMFEAVDGQLYFTAQWYYRAKDTVIQETVKIDNRRIFYSDVKDRNLLESLVENITIVRLPLHVDLDVKDKRIQDCKYYCNTKYLLPHSTFVNLLPGNSCHSNSELTKRPIVRGECTQELKLLDLYAGCGGMSTGLCLGAHLSNVNLVTKWAVDINEYALESLKLNHPETEVRNEQAENFLILLKKWKALCICFNLVEGDCSEIPANFFATNDPLEEEEDDDEETENAEDSGVYEVERLLDICFGKPDEKDEGLYFKVHWKGYGSDEDTWEPLESLRDCKDSVQEFVTRGFKSKVLPLPGDVDVVCGGPPCQGISGFNRFRDKLNPLNDEKNKQAIVFMDIVQYLKPKYVLMENVVDLLRFADGYLGRYALGRLVDMNYQARLGMMCAGAYGLPQFRMRVFLWGACATERLPQYPLPTHDVVKNGSHTPLEWEENTVCKESHEAALRPKLLLEDALSDLPAVTNYESRDEMSYGSLPQTEFQKMIRLGRNYLLGSSKSEPYNLILYDHRPLRVNADDYERICHIPKEKGANFRNLKGVRVRSDNIVEWVPDIERQLLKSGRPLVPDYAMTYVNGKSPKPFGRLWWDEIVSTVVTRAEPHNQVILHPDQDRVLTIRENARLQGFPDYYKLCGPVKERYIQVGNAVAVPVARVLGYSLGRSIHGYTDDCSVFELPSGFPNYLEEFHSPDQM